MSYLIRRNLWFTCLAIILWFHASPLAAQKTGSPQFELTQYEFEAGSTTRVELILTATSSQANIINIQIPFEKAEMAIESVSKIEEGNSSELWLTKDSVLFEKKFPGTALILTRSKSILIQTSSPINTGERIMIRFILSVPNYRNHKEVVTTQKSQDKNMVVSLSNKASSGSAIKYFSIKPVTIKQLDKSKL